MRRHRKSMTSDVDFIICRRVHYEFVRHNSAFILRARITRMTNETETDQLFRIESVSEIDSTAILIHCRSHMSKQYRASLNSKSRKVLHIKIVKVDNFSPIVMNIESRNFIAWVKNKVKKRNYLRTQLM